MRSSKRITVLFAAVVILAMAGSVLVVRRLDGARLRAEEDRALYLSDPKLLKRLSLGYSGLMADIYWTRAVQYFGSRHKEGARDYPLLYPLLDVTTQLDPHLVVAYQFGGVFLAQHPPDGAGQPDKAAEFVERGIRANPDAWRLYFNLGYIHYIERKDYVAARDAFERGSRVPGAHPALKLLAAASAQQAGTPEAARLLWSSVYESTEDQSVKANAARHLIALRVDEEVPQLEALVQRFRDNTGRMPSNFHEMVAAGWLRELPRDPTGLPYVLRDDGRVEVQSPEGLPYITKGLPPGYQSGPVGIKLQK